MSDGGGVKVILTGNKQLDDLIVRGAMAIHGSRLRLDPAVKRSKALYGRLAGATKRGARRSIDRISALRRRCR